MALINKFMMMEKMGQVDDSTRQEYAKFLMVLRTQPEEGDIYHAGTLADEVLRSFAELAVGGRAEVALLQHRCKRRNIHECDFEEAILSWVDVGVLEVHGNDETDMFVVQGRYYISISSSADSQGRLT